jgi:tetratricopeptide (TPR) repeat protein
VRSAAKLVYVLMGVATSSAHAESADALVEQGERFAKAGRLTDAINAFKRADRIEPRARHACLIGLAYVRRELLPQAELFLDACRERADQRDPLPDWFALAEVELRRKLASSDHAPIAIRVEPNDRAAATRFTVSSFAPDETFSPRPLHLPIGTHLVKLQTDGREIASREITIADRSPREIVFDLAAPREAPAASRPRRLPWIITAAGGAILLGGAAYHAFAFAPARDDLAAASAEPDPGRYRALEPTFESRRRTTLVLYGVGVAAVATGLVMRALQRDDRAPRIGFSPVDRGALVSIELRR